MTATTTTTTKKRKCRDLLRLLKEALNDKPRIWIVRDLRYEIAWNNAFCASFFGMHGDSISWRAALAHVHHDDAARVEDAHSRALKLGGEHSYRVRGRISATQMAVFRSTCSAFRCYDCDKGCAYVVILSDVVLDRSSSQSDYFQSGLTEHE